MQHKIHIKDRVVFRRFNVEMLHIYLFMKGNSNDEVLMLRHTVPACCCMWNNDKSYKKYYKKTKKYAIFTVITPQIMF